MRLIEKLKQIWSLKLCDFTDLILNLVANSVNFGNFMLIICFENAVTIFLITEHVNIWKYQTVKAAKMNLLDIDWIFLRRPWFLLVRCNIISLIFYKLVLKSLFCLFTNDNIMVRFWNLWLLNCLYSVDVYELFRLSEIPKIGQGLMGWN